MLSIQKPPECNQVAKRVQRANHKDKSWRESIAQTVTYTPRFKVEQVILIPLGTGS